MVGFLICRHYGEQSGLHLGTGLDDLDSRHDMARARHDISDVNTQHVLAHHFVATNLGYISRRARAFEAPQSPTLPPRLPAPMLRITVPIQGNLDLFGNIHPQPRRRATSHRPGPRKS